MAIGRIAGRLARKWGSSKQKQALKKAQAASAKARSSGAKAAVKKTAVKSAAPKVSRKVRRTAVESAAAKRVGGMKLQRNAKGRVKASSFKGKAGKALRKSTYQDRLNSSRANYRSGSAGSKVKQGAKGYVTGLGVTARRYKDLTVGENIRRDIGRGLKVGALSASAGAAVAGSNIALSELKKKRDRNDFKANSPAKGLSDQTIDRILKNKKK